ncbi:hypothetical protein IV417_14320 [Alphaproteobacteria bacterium KMM 3653]|uniref:Tat pathway signal sequence domain protein n=1 Tax=Harenicola maris TaxID=2841044 RepID=A0AAP2CS84_9RHOB|nr:hypothetical protein [Harenicola maris]
MTGLGKSLLGITAAALCAGPLVAQEADISGKILVELNQAVTSGSSCTLTFMVTNGLESAIDKAVYETVLFDAEGQVKSLTLFDFGALPVARPRVRQFAVPEVTCEGLGRVLINGANTCEGADLAEGVCGSAVVPSTRVAIEVLG